MGEVVDRAKVRWVRTIWSVLSSGGYEPNEAQAAIVKAFVGGTRFLLLCGGERAGKSMTSVAMALIEMGPREGDADGKSSRMYWIVGPDYAQARAEFEYILRAMREGGFLKSESTPETKTLPWVLETIWGVRVETRTSSDISKLASFSIHGALMVEAAQQSYDTWLKLRGRVSETRGWVILSGTLEQGLPWYANMLRQWRGKNQDGGRSFSLPTWSNTAIYPGGRQDPEILALERSMPLDYFMERFGAEPRTMRGLVIPEFDYATHVRDLEFRPEIPVNLAVDPARHTYAVLFCQRIGLVTHVLDAVYLKQTIVHEVVKECQKNPLWKFVNKREGNVIDIAGTHRDANKSQVQLWQELAGVSFVWRFLPLHVTIDTVRYRLSTGNEENRPLVYFNSTLPNPEPLPDGAAAHFLGEFDLWRWPEQKPGRNDSPKPIDKANDGIKALGYYLVAHYGPSMQKRVKPAAKRLPYIA